jgi:nitroreductase
MDFKELALTRYSVRDYLPTEVENEKLEIILNTMRMAPSAVNFQPYKLFVLRKGERQNAVKAAYHRDWLKNVPIVLVLVGNHAMAWKRAQDGKDHMDIDTAIAIDHLQLQAADLGLGTCWICNFDVKACSEALGLGNKEEPVAIIPLGYPASTDIPVKKRKGLDELIVYL